MASLQGVQLQLDVWSGSTLKSLEQLSSLANLVDQVEAVRRGKLGVLSQHPHVAALLEVKLIQAMERTLARIKEEKKVLTQVAQKLKKYAKESQSAFEKNIATKKGLEFTCGRTAEEFSQGDHTHWLRQLHSAYRANLEEKSRALQDLCYTSTSLAHICSVWDKKPSGIEETLLLHSIAETLGYFHYSIENYKTRIKINDTP